MTGKRAARQQPHEVDIQVGANIRRVRLEVGMSQGVLGAQIGVTFQQLQKYEHAVNRVSASKLWQITKALNCSLSDLFAGVDERPVGEHAAK